MQARPKQGTAPGLSLKGRALKYLAAREHSRLELTRKLAAHAESPEQIDAVLDEILLRYEGYELERTPIQLTNYHENCKL